MRTYNYGIVCENSWLQIRLSPLTDNYSWHLAKFVLTTVQTRLKFAFPVSFQGNERLRPKTIQRRD